MCQRLSISEEDVPGFSSVGRMKGSSLGSYVGMGEATAKVWSTRLQRCECLHTSVCPEWISSLTEADKSNVPASEYTEH